MILMNDGMYYSWVILNLFRLSEVLVRLQDTAGYVHMHNSCNNI